MHTRAHTHTLIWYGVFVKISGYPCLFILDKDLTFAISINTRLDLSVQKFATTNQPTQLFLVILLKDCLGEFSIFLKTAQLKRELTLSFSPSRALYLLICCFHTPQPFCHALRQPIGLAQGRATDPPNGQDFRYPLRSGITYQPVQSYTIWIHAISEHN